MINSYNESNVKKLTKYIKSNKKYRDIQSLVFIGIGTDKILFDSVGPLVGSLINHYGLNINYYGDMDNPIHALNMVEALEFIQMKHPNSVVIAVDSSISPEGGTYGLGRVSVRKGSLLPGLGLGKELPEVGDISIRACIFEGEMDEVEDLYSTSIQFVYRLAEDVVNMIQHTIENLSGNIG